MTAINAAAQRAPTPFGNVKGKFGATHNFLHMGHRRGLFSIFSFFDNNVCDQYEGLVLTIDTHVTFNPAA